MNQGSPIVHSMTWANGKKIAARLGAPTDIEAWLATLEMLEAAETKSMKADHRGTSEIIALAGVAKVASRTPAETRAKLSKQAKQASEARR